MKNRRVKSLESKNLNCFKIKYESSLTNLFLQLSHPICIKHKEYLCVHFFIFDFNTIIENKNRVFFF